MPLQTRRLALPAFIAMVLAATAQAQDATTTVVAPPMECQKPGDFAPLDRASPDAARFQKKVDEYKACVGVYSRTNGAKANELAAQSRVYSDAANKAIDDYNAYVGELNEKAKAAQKK